MQLTRLRWPVLLFLLSCIAPASAADVTGASRRGSTTEIRHIQNAYGSVPGNGTVSSESRRLRAGDAKAVTRRYGSMPGNGTVSGEARRMRSSEARGILRRYGSVPGNGMVKGEAHKLRSSAASDVTRRYGSVPGNGVTRSEVRRTHAADLPTVGRRYGSVPGGVVLEGSASGIPPMRKVVYDARRQLLVLDSKHTYLPRVPAHGLLGLVRAISKDDRIGVSLTDETAIAYGAFGVDSALARDLMLADLFLADLVIPPREWTVGYKLSGGFETRMPEGEESVAVFFRWGEFEFAMRDGAVTLERAKVDVVLVPVLDQRASDGGYVVDPEISEHDPRLAAYEQNAHHLSSNIDYYLRERIVERALAYGELAALIRHLKKSGADLGKLVRSIELAHGKEKPITAASLDESWSGYLKELQSAGAHANWSAPPHDLYVARVRLKAETGR